MKLASGALAVGSENGTCLCFSGSLHFVFQLTTGSIDVASARIADGCFLARAFQLLNPTLLRCSGAWLVGASLNFVN